MSTTANQAILPTTQERHLKYFERDGSLLHKAPIPLYRHATPSSPWPWMKFHVDPSEIPNPPGLPGKIGWTLYPQSLFPNWTRDQVNRSQMLTKCSDSESSTVHELNIYNDGRFDDERVMRAVRRTDLADLRAYWNELATPSPSNIRVQALFVEDMTLPVLQMLGTRYNIEPFFFASSANWIPSSYQEDPKALEDHITVVLPFVRCLKSQRPIVRTKRLTPLTPTSTESQKIEEPLPYMQDKAQMIDTQAPLSLPDDKILIQDLLSLHMIRNPMTSTIIYGHPGPESQGTSAGRLWSLARRMGDSIYWSKIFKDHKDPTFLFLAMMWYALYAWDEAFEVLFRYTNALETDVLRFNNLKLTQELHKLQAHVLYYEQLLRSFCRSVEFVRDTPNPAMSAPSVTNAEREASAKHLHIEANNLLSELKRLIHQRELLSERLDNAIHLAFATVNIQESKAMQALAEVTMNNSSNLKQIAYLTMAFLPATFLANTFSMNVKEINPPTTGSLANYVEAVVGLTLLTCWLTIALQKDSSFFPPRSGVFRRGLWPLFYMMHVASSELRRWLTPIYRHSQQSQQDIQQRSSYQTSEKNARSIVPLT